jgi:CheY-like chemotaxis protein
MNHPTIWLIGDFTSAEFSFATADLSSAVQRRWFAAPQEAIAFAQDHAPAEVVVIAQSRPGQVAAADVERLHAAGPLSRMILLLGAWCEGEMRTGQPIAGLTRIFWHAFPRQVNRLLEELGSGRSAPWAFPRIAAQHERLLSELPARREDQAEGHAGSIFIRAVNHTAFEILSDSFEQRGHGCNWLDPQRLTRFRSCDWIVWDAPRLDEPEWRLLAACRQAMASVPLLLLAGFPREEDLRQAHALGVRSMLAKPFSLADLKDEAAAALPGGQRDHPPRQKVAG